MKKIIAILLLFTAFSANMFAQSKEDIYKELVKKFKDLKSFSFDFTQSENTAVSGFIKAKGETKFYIDLKENTIVSNGKKVWHYIKKDNAVQISNYDAGSMEFAPQKFFFLFEKDFIPEKLEKEQSSKGESSWVLTCSTKSKKLKSVKYLKLWLDVKTKEIRIAQVSAESGVQTWFIKKLEINKKISDKLFEYKAPKGAKTNDLR